MDYTPNVYWLLKPKPAVLTWIAAASWKSGFQPVYLWATSSHEDLAAVELEGRKLQNLPKICHLFSMKVRCIKALYFLPTLQFLFTSLSLDNCWCVPYRYLIGYAVSMLLVSTSIFGTGKPNKSKKLACSTLNSGSKTAQEQFFGAAEAGDLAAMNCALAHGAIMSQADNHYPWRSALMYASEAGHYEVAVFLIRSGAFIDEQDNRGWSSLMYATRRHHLEVMKLLIEGKAKPNLRTRDGGTTALLEGISHPELVEYLIGVGADFELANDDGYTPLLMATYVGGINSADLLLKHKADVNAATINGNTSLIIAAKNNSEALVNLLLNAGAHVGACDKTGRTALYWAQKNGNSNMAEKLIQVAKAQPASNAQSCFKPSTKKGK